MKKICKLNFLYKHKSFMFYDKTKKISNLKKNSVNLIMTYLFICKIIQFKFQNDNIKLEDQNFYQLD